MTDAAAAGAVSDASEPLVAAEPTTPRGRKIRFGVAFRLLLAFFGAAAFAVAASLFALMAFNEYRAGFDRIASTRLPALVAAGELTQRSQALAANAPSLAVADSHFTRQAVATQLAREVAVRALAEIIAALCHTELVVHSRPARCGEIRISIGDPRHAAAQLDFTAKTALADGLATTLDALRHSAEVKTRVVAGTL